MLNWMTKGLSQSAEFCSDGRNYLSKPTRPTLHLGRYEERGRYCTMYVIHGAISMLCGKVSVPCCQYVLGEGAAGNRMATTFIAKSRGVSKIRKRKLFPRRRKQTLRLELASSQVLPGGTSFVVHIQSLCGSKVSRIVPLYPYI